MYFDGIVPTPRQSPFALTSLTGAHGLKAETHEIDQYERDGTIYIDSRVNARDIIITGKITEDITVSRRILLNTLNPRTQGWLVIYGRGVTRSIRCVVDTAPVFAGNDGSIFTITLRCPNPYYIDGDVGDEMVQEKQLAGWEGQFEFPKEFIENSREIAFETIGEPVNETVEPLDGGFEFGILNPDVSTVITNDGVVSIGMALIIRATAPISQVPARGG